MAELHSHQLAGDVQVNVIYTEFVLMSTKEMVYHTKESVFHPNAKMLNKMPKTPVMRNAK
jgi:hypothetical protein